MQLSFEKVSDHEVELRRYFDRFEISPDVRPTNKPVCIMLFTNRSGSSLISHHIRASGKFSAFGEPLNHKLVIQRCEREGIKSFEGYLQWEVDEFHREGTMLGFKASYGQAMMLIRSGAIPHFFNDVRWVIIQRRDVLSQAISFSIAEQTRQWHSFDSGNEAAPEYDYERILNRIRNLSESYTAINTFCSVFGLDAYRIDYEDFALDPVQGARDLALHLGVEDIEIDSERIDMQKQRNELNDQFRTRFIEDYHTTLLATDPEGQP